MYTRALFEKRLLKEQKVLMSYALKITKNWHLAEDMTQDTIVKALEHWELYRPGTFFRSWLLAILQNTFISHERRSWRFVPSDQAHIINDDSWKFAGRDNDVLTAQEASVMLKETLAGFRRTSKDPAFFVIFLTKFQDFTHQEAAEFLKLPVGTIKSRTTWAMERLDKDKYSWPGES